MQKMIKIFVRQKLVNKEESSKVNEELVLALNALGYKNSDINKVVKNVPSNLKIEELNQKLTMMELEGLIKNLPGNNYARL